MALRPVCKWFAALLQKDSCIVCAQTTTCACCEQYWRYTEVQTRNGVGIDPDGPTEMLGYRAAVLTPTTAAWSSFDSKACQTVCERNVLKRRELQRLCVRGGVVRRAHETAPFDCQRAVREGLCHVEMRSAS